MGRASTWWTPRGPSARRASIVGASFGVAALVAFRWWEGWDQNRECTGIFADCFNESVAPLWIGVPVLLLFAWLGLFALRVERRWLVMVLAGPLNALAAVAVHAVEPRFIAVAVVSSISWGIGGLAAPKRSI